MTPVIVPIVEGLAEVESVPVLLRRLLAELGAPDLGVAKPFRVKRNKVVKEGELERAVDFAVRSREGVAAVLVILDADDDCPAELGQQLLARCKNVCGKPAAVVLANRELEAWFLAAKQSLRGVRGIRDAAEVPAEPEGVRGAKERLSANMEGRRYLDVDDQPALAAEFNLGQAQAGSPSFSKLMRSVQHLVDAIQRPLTSQGPH